MMISSEYLKEKNSPPEELTPELLKNVNPDAMGFDGPEGINETEE